VTRWEIQVPLRDRDDRIDLADAYDMSRELPGDDAKVSRALVLLAVTDSAYRTYGDLLDRIESASLEERRRCSMPLASPPDCRRPARSSDGGFRGGERQRGALATP
jgi:hypothetical protein